MVLLSIRDDQENCYQGHKENLEKRAWMGQSQVMGDGCCAVGILAGRR
jgi:hypothetical protein